MKRAERVRHIIDQIGTKLIFAHFEYVPSGLALVIDEFDRWHARIHSDINPAGWRTNRSGLPFAMGLWLAHGPKVLSVEFSHEKLAIINMRHGDWETEFFGLPVFEGRSRLQWYQLGQRASRRWVSGNPPRPRFRREDRTPHLHLVQ